MAKFCESSNVYDRIRICQQKALAPEKIAAVKSTIESKMSISLSKLALKLNTSKYTVHRVTKVIKSHPYRVSIHQELKPADCPKRVHYCKWLIAFGLRQMEKFDNFCSSDETWFALDGYVNSQTCFVCHQKVRELTLTRDYILQKLKY